MIALITFHNMVFDAIERALASWLIPTAARLVFAGVLLIYFWNSAMTKLGDGVFGILSPSDGAYIQIFPKAMEAAGYDSSQLGVFHWLVAVAGTAAEFLLPFLILIGLATRLAAIGMTGFVLVQSYVDITGHGVGGADLGAWFDGASGALILDQRSLWLLLFLVLILRGAGPVSVDAVLRKSWDGGPEA